MENMQCVILIGFFYFVSSKIIIKELSVPESIPLNSDIDIIDLDCNYESINESGIEVKWFFNGYYDQIYQWVPGYNDSRTALGILKDRLDTRYKVTNDSASEYRGFRITDIGRELSGNYTCKVSGDTDEASLTKQMVVYSPAKSGAELILLNNEALVICSADGIYPEPLVDLYIQRQNGQKTDLKEDLEVDETEDGSYNITATHSFGEYNDSLTETTKFVCNISIPGTDYFLIKELIHLGNGFDQTQLSNVTFDEDSNRNLTSNGIAEEITSTGGSGTLGASLSILAAMFSILYRF